MTIAIRMSNAAAAELYMCEVGSLEDLDGAARYGDTHACNIIMRGNRGKTDTRMKLTDGEAAEMYFSLCSGTFQLEHMGFLPTARRLAARLRDAARRYDAELVRAWPEPSGF